MMCEIIDVKNGTTCYISGVIKPGEYIEKLYPLTDLPNKAFDAKIVIYTFEEDTWYSSGTIEIDAVVQAW